MIVVEVESGLWILARQTDHAAMCGELAAAWRRPTDIPAAVWPRFLEAVRRHDDGWNQAEQHPALHATGRPHDFKTLPTADHAAIWRRSMDLTEADDPYLALLTCLHARWLYGHVVLHPGESDQRQAQQLMAELAQRADGYIETLRAGEADDRRAVEPTALAAARSLLTVLDKLSLTLLGGLPGIDDLGAAPFGERSQAITLIDRDAAAGTARCAPWPFSPRSVTVRCPAYDITADQTRDPAALGRTLQQPAKRAIAWTLRPAGG